ncbi:hypothetical protein [Endozoicomonas euniceicola]|uniref:Uncharacterized protein n=1 Tax=Endozoicomonas euniceicola TaxID=1234143 RepID=A0ABY6GPW0_9GAMM|nr:hypothetical protein [Endozoicomonas euniceicola]UYM14101.1 hypothetical protein NX720_14415 [Endozoicomonas euniceicola]
MPDNGPCRCHDCLQADSIESRGILKQRFPAEHLRERIPGAFQALLEKPINRPPETVIRQLYPHAHIIRETASTESVTEERLSGLPAAQAHPVRQCQPPEKQRA